MNIFFLLWLAVRRAVQAMGRSMDQQDQRDVDNYLGKAQSFADLESRERYWLQSH